MKLSSSIVVLLSAVCTGVSALPKPTGISKTAATIDVSRIRIVNSSMEKARFHGLPTSDSGNPKNDWKIGDKKKKSLESNDIISFAREHANVAAYIAIAYTVAMVVKCECTIQSSCRLSIHSFICRQSHHSHSILVFPWMLTLVLPFACLVHTATFFNNNHKGLSKSDMDIIHEILSEEEEEESSPAADEQELLEDEWMTQTTMEMEDMIPPPPPQVETTEQRRRPSHGVRRVRGGAASAALLERLRIGMYFAVWYALNIVYNSK
jgi:hypothetical protein